MSGMIHAWHRVFAFGVALAMALCGVKAAAQDSDDRQARCQALAGRTIKDSTIESARTYRSPSAGRTYCIVLARVGMSELKFKLHMPVEGWNGKFVYLGGGGFHGSMHGDDPPAHVSSSITSQPYAWASSNGGHDVAGFGADYFAANFAFDQRQLDDFTHLAIHRSLPSAREILNAFLGRLPSRSYFEGGSMGGQQALILAQRFPDDFDGITARAPAGNVVGLFLQFHRVQQAFSQPVARLAFAQRKSLAAAVLARCDDLDGVEDGIISSPQRCTFDPVELRCGSGYPKDICLSDPQIRAVRAVVEGFSIFGGAISHPGYNWGGEDQDEGWYDYIWENPATGWSAQSRFAQGFIRAFVTRDRNFDPAEFKAEDWEAQLRKLVADFQATNPDLGRFHARDGKLILFTGTIDTSVSPRDTIGYYEAVVRSMGRKAADETVELFVAPGAGHGQPGLGANQVDFLAALDAWVEGGPPPSRQHLIASRPPVLGVPFTRPLCRYPAYPGYTGGPVSESGSYRCVE